MILRGIAKFGDHTGTKKGDIALVYAIPQGRGMTPGCFPRVGCPNWLAPVTQFTFVPASKMDYVRAAKYIWRDWRDPAHRSFLERLQR